MRRFPITALAALVLLVLAANAWAHHLDPRRQIAPADQARARAMLLRQSDLGASWEAAETGNVGHLTCKGYDEHDLTVTGDAGPKAWVSLRLELVEAQARIYRTVADANTSWRRETSLSGRSCAATEMARLSPVPGTGVLSLKQIAFPKIAPRIAAYRMVLRFGTQAPHVTALVVAIERSRAQAVVSSIGLAAQPSIDLVRLARLTAARMAKAMRGS